MAGRGPAPKGRRARARDEAATRSLPLDGEVRGLDLPGYVDWHPQTVVWWETWRRSPQAQEFQATDWSFLLDTALMHHTMWRNERWEFAAELRLRSAKFGATVEDRLRLRQSIVTPGDVDARPVGSVADIASRRARLMG